MRVLPKFLESKFNIPGPTTFCAHKFITPENNLIECVGIATRERHGWLCNAHYDALAPKVRSTSNPTNLEMRLEEKDNAIVASVIATDTREISKRNFDLRLPFRGLVMEDPEALDEDIDYED